MYTIRSLSKEIGIPYTTLRGYIMELKKLKLIKAPDGPSGLMINEKEKILIEKVARLIREKGYSLRAAVSELQKEREDAIAFERIDEIMIKIQEIFERLESIEKSLQECFKKRRKKWWMFWK